MGRVLNGLKSFASNAWVKWFVLPAAAIAAVGIVVSAGSAPSIPAVNLAAEPLYARGARAKPTLTLALSVEFPTVGAQYVNVPNTNTDDSYAPTKEYIGYFDAESCYTYNGTPAESRPTGVPVDDYRRFDRVGDAARDGSGASLRTCGGTAFSGNFLNWSTGSAIDILRYGLTGGDRWVDTTSLTILQRAVLPNGKFWNDNNFPAKILKAALVDGAVPTTLKVKWDGTTHTGDIYIANCLNRVHFGTASGGNCGAPGTNSNLGTPYAGASTGPVTTSGAGALPGTFTYCADQNGTCAFTGIKQVAYGSSTIGWRFMSARDGVACTTTAFGGSPGSGTKKCYIRNDPTGWDPGTRAGLTPDNFFYTRVTVCTASVSGVLTDPRTSLCQRYPNGNYKPVGNLQKYSDLMRVAAFGYLADDSAASGNGGARYGGVLRAPMKYVGQQHFDANFNLVSGANPNAEWNAATGIFNTNPDSAAEGKSGVANYLNQFGRTGTFGYYKTYDPVGEMYYESLRYLQGLAPTSGTTPETSPTYGMTTAMKDGFPVYDTWTDPHPAVSGMTDYSCVKNNIVGIGDVNTHSDKYIPGNPRATNGDAVRAADVSANEPNFYQWTKVVGGFEEGRSVSYTDGTGAARTTSNFNAANAITPDLEDKTPPCCNGNAYFMAGVAYWANTHDIRGTDWSNTAKRRPGMRVTTYMLDVNEYGRQNVQATRRNNQFYFAAKYGGFKDVTRTGNPYKSYESGTQTVIDSNENWERATSDVEKKEAKNYFLSSSAREVLKSLDEIFAKIAEEANSIAGGAISTQRVTSSAGYIYQAQFNPADWSGDLVAYPVTANASGVVDIGTQASSPWRNAAGTPVGAAGMLADKTPGSRNIVVGGNPTDVAGTYSAASFNPTNFVWASLDTVNQDALRMPPYAASGATMDAVAVGQRRLDYLRGVRTNEAGAGGTDEFRKRGFALGDIVNSGVVYTGAPENLYSDSAYQTFASTYADRKKALYVGANDGMLHAFDADTGNELFAYIPRWLVPQLPALTSQSYVHRSYADGSPAVAEAKVGTAWKTVLVAGSGGGGQGVFALDVSRPESFGAGSVMWEFTDRDDPAMGNVIGRPQILKFRRGAPGAADPDYLYYAVVASGVNNYVDDGHWSDGSPVIFLLDLNKASNEAWIENTNYYKIRFPVATTTIATGMVGFSARLGAADEVTYVYAGDLQGNLWKLDFTKVGQANWTVEKLSFFRNSSDEPLPMYIALDSLGNRQPISMEPALVFGASRSIIVSFGTGKFLDVIDNSGPFKAQSVYSLIDTNSAVPDTSSGAVAAIAGRGRLQAATVTASDISVADFNWGRPASDDDTTTRSGWYFDFYLSSGTTAASPGTGERQISNFGVLQGKLIFGSVIPSVNSCDNGQGKLYIIDIKSGDGGSEVSPVGILGEPFLTQVGSSTLDISDTTGRRRETTRYQPILQGSSGLAAPSGLGLTIESYAGRLSWREITNYQELRNAP